jgi:Tfp pilus assembly ATPase PilU
MLDYKKEIEDIILSVIREGGSDIIFPPTIRYATGNLVPLMKKTVLTAEDTLGFLLQLLQRQKEEFLKTKEIDFSWFRRRRLRECVYQRGAVGIALRYPENKNIAGLIFRIFHGFRAQKTSFFSIEDARAVNPQHSRQWSI